MNENRRGVVLLIVLWVLLVLTVVAWTSTRQSQMELRMTGFHVDSMRAYYLARAGISRGLVYLREDKLKDHGVLGEDDLIEVDDKDENWLYDAPAEEWGYNPDAYGIDPDDDEEDWGAEIDGFARGKFTVEIEDLSGLLNINFATVEQLGRLLEVLGHEEEVSQVMAAAIVDYIDADDQPTILDQVDVRGFEFGDPTSESYYYNPEQSPDDVDISGPEFMMRDAPIVAVEELLLVPGITELVYHGEDANGDGELDDNEDDEEEFPPFDNGDGELQLGLKDYVTVFSGLAHEPFGKPNLNSAPFEVIFALLWGPDESPETAESAAEKIVDYREGSDRFLGSDDDKRFRTIDHSDENNDGIDKAGLDPGTLSTVTSNFSVASDYFRIVSTSTVNEVKRTLKMTVVRSFSEDLEISDGRSRTAFDRDAPQVEQVRLLVIDFEEEG